MKKIYTIILLLTLTSCEQKPQEKSLTEGGMKCGAGKCGASMVDGSTILVKKKMNIVNQLKENDSRRECVLNAENTKALYNCVRDPKTKRLSIKEIESNRSVEKKVSVMKCQAGKCGGIELVYKLYDLSDEEIKIVTNEM